MKQIRIWTIAYMPFTMGGRVNREIATDIIPQMLITLSMPGKIDIQVAQVKATDGTLFYAECLSGGLMGIWQSDGETTFHKTVIPLRRESIALEIENVECWNENAMRGQLYMGLCSRYRFYDLALSNSPDISKLVGLESAEKMRDFLTNTDDEYHAWAAMFWKAFFEGAFPNEFFNAVAGKYVSCYMMEEFWEDDWQQYLEDEGWLSAT